MFLLLTLYAFLCQVKLPYSMMLSAIVCLSSFLVHVMLQILSSILEQVPLYFSIRLAIVATRKECINFVRWLDDNIRTHKDVFVEVGFLVHAQALSSLSQQNPSIQH